ncbi:MAG TPA: hypothetical protein VFN61_05290 [Acidimicrobiales bacterium]|nr:hypothetical protein [Acidimicrobiales bacterium]
MGAISRSHAVLAMSVLTALSVSLTCCGSPGALDNSRMYLRQAKDQYLGIGAVLGAGGQTAQPQLAVADLKEIHPLSNTDVLAIRFLEQLETIPVSEPTAKDEARAGKAVAFLNKFFGVSGFGSGCLDSGPGITRAASNWFEEPGSFASGVRVGPLRKTASWLQFGERADTGDKTCYPALIDDITDLELLKQKHVGPLTDPRNLFIAITYVNNFFEQNGVSHEHGAVLETASG